MKKKLKLVHFTIFYILLIKWSVKHITLFFHRQRARYLYKKRSKFVKNEHALYTLGMKKGKNLERLITATSQARF